VSALRLLRAILTITVVVVVTSGCSGIKVAAWEKEHLADPAMTMVPDTLDRRFIDHIYFSREASSGGFGIGGGGCGCN